VKEYTLKTRLFDRSRKLILAPDFVAFENKDFKGNEFTRIEKHILPTSDVTWTKSSGMIIQQTPYLLSRQRISRVNIER
jgi:hypothetical protein